jgi:hypothetical protein
VPWVAPEQACAMTLVAGPATLGSNIAEQLQQRHPQVRGSIAITMAGVAAAVVVGGEHGHGDLAQWGRAHAVHRPGAWVEPCEVEERTGTWLSSPSSRSGGRTRRRVVEDDELQPWSRPGW